MNEIKKNQIKPESQFQSLLFNIIIPVLLLNKGSAYLGTKGALMIALAFPITYGLYDWFQRRKTNFISLLGLLNVALTGGLALSGLGGGWFAVKEAAFPALIGLFVLGSAFSARPFIKTMFLNEQFVYVDLIQAKVQEAQKEEEMQRLIKNSTILLSLSFALSAVLNFGLAQYIFRPIDPSNIHAEQILNEQIAQMTSWSFVVIMLPSITFLSGVFWYFIVQLTKITGLKHTQFFKNH